MDHRRRDDEIVAQYLRGKTLREIGAQFSLTGERVRQIVQERGLPPRASMTQQRAREAAQAIVDSDSALTLSGASQQWGVGAETIQKVLRDEMEYDYHAARRLRSLDVHRDRIEGIGENQCSVCGEVKPWDEFARTKVKGVPSRATRCKVCLARQFREWYRRSQAKPKKIPKNKECSNCGLTKPAAQFPPHKAATTGLGSWCRECHNEHMREVRV